MELIYTDPKGKELGYVKDADIDFEVGSDEKNSVNDFEIKFSRSGWNGQIKFESMMYVPDTEYGGIVREISTSTKADSITAKGYTWRGLMTKKIIKPESGQDYATVSGELNTIIKQKVQEAFPGLFVGADEDTGVKVTNYQFARYCTLHDGLRKMLQSVGYRMEIKFIQAEKENAGHVQVRAIPITDYSSEYEYSSDSDIDFKVDIYKGGVNHLICLGKGELKDRTVIHLYVDSSGNIGQTQYYKGVDEVEAVYDSSGAERDDLLKGGKDKLYELMNKTEYDMTMEKIEGNVDIGDIVGGRDYLTGVIMKKPIGRKIWKASGGKEKIEYKLEGES
jgi:hypothetical protein